jgi:hypothetical protein
VVGEELPDEVEVVAMVHQSSIPWRLSKRSRRLEGK